MAEEIIYTLEEYDRFYPYVETSMIQGGVSYCHELIQNYTELIDSFTDDVLNREYRVIIRLLRRQIYIMSYHGRDDDDLQITLDESFNTNQTSSITPMVEINIQLIIKNMSRLALPSDTGKCVICYGNCFEESNPEMVVPIPCGKVHDFLHVDCFRNYAKTSSSCPMCRKNMSLELDTVVSTANKIISESVTCGIEASNITIDGIKKIIENLIKGKTLNITRFLAISKFTCITSWKEMFTIIGCKYNDDESKVSLPLDSKSSATLFSDALTLLKEI